MRDKQVLYSVLRVCVVILVVLAGCAGIGPDGVDSGNAPTETLTPVPVPEADPGTLRTSGINESGVTDPEALAVAHERWLDGRSYTFVSNQTIRYENGSVHSQYEVHLRLATDRSYHATVRTGGQHGPKILGEPPAFAEFWSDKETYVRAFGEPEPVYNEFSPTSSGVGTWYFWATSGAFDLRMTPGVMIYSSFDAIPTRTEHRRTEAGIPRYQLSEANSTTTDLPFHEARPARDVRLEADVDGTGLVRYLELQYRAEANGEPVVVTRRISYSDVGATDVERPEWFGEATRTT